MRQLELAQYNILNHADDWNAKAHAIAAMLSDRHTAIAFLQEIPYAHDTEICAALAERGYDMTFARLQADRADRAMLAWDATRLHRLGDPMTPAGPDMVAAILSDDLGMRAVACSMHAPWGARRQAKRLEAVRRALTVMREPNDPGAIMLLCGDLNARPGEPCIRLLSGESVEPEYWTEAQDTAVLLGRAGHALATTLDGSHPMAAHTARLVDADPGRIPARRIDYMFSEGWNHGRRGGWTGDVSLTDTGWSDHMLMEASILV